MTTSSVIRWGILGPGAIARQFAADLRALPGATLAAVASRDAEKARAFAGEFSNGGARAFGSYEELAAAPGIDIVYIATPHNLHRAHTLLCLAGGKAVLCEKPFCLNATEAAEVFAMAAQRGLFCMEAMWTRFLPLLRRLPELLAEGAVGEARLLTADFGFPCAWDPQSRLLNRALAGGGLLDVGVYPLSFTEYLWGEPQSVSGLAKIGETGVDEHAAWLLGYADGRIAAGSCAVRANTPQEATIGGTEGRLRIHAPWWRPTKLTIHPNQGPARELDFPYEGNGYRYEAQAAMECLRAGKTACPVIPPAASLSVLRTMDALRRQWGLRYPGES